jgi:putative ABC transport system permease protein
MGWDEPVGKRLTFSNGQGGYHYLTIIGVVKDFHFESLHSVIKPFLFNLNTSFYDGYFSILLNPCDLDVAADKLEKVWTKFAPDDPLISSFYDDEFARIYRNEMSARKIMLIFTFLAVIIACLGLLGMVSYTAGRRTKEVGVRKSLGASSISILWLFLRNLVITVLIANLIAWPLAWYGTNKWLNDFAYRVNLNFGTLVLVAAGAVLICVLTVGYQSFRIASSNPSDALHYE